MWHIPMLSTATAEPRRNAAECTLPRGVLSLELLVQLASMFGDGEGFHSQALFSDGVEVVVVQLAAFEPDARSV